MLFWIFVFVMVIAIVTLVILATNSKFASYKYDGLGFASAVTAFIAGLISLIILLIIIVNNTALDAQIAQLHERYEALIYQWENNVYENDNDIGKRELIKDIQEWNEDLAYYKKAQYNDWIGVFTPNIYDAFEFIEWKEVG